MRPSCFTATAPTCRIDISSAASRQVELASSPRTSRTTWLEMLAMEGLLGGSPAIYAFLHGGARRAPHRGVGADPGDVN